MVNSRIAMGASNPLSAGARYRFGPFELDGRTGELRKGGTKVRLQDQPFQILQVLLERPGEVVPREEIQSRLWPNNTTVEFDHGINAAVRRLRVALGDSAEEPRYIETLARRGYRFLAAVERESEEIRPGAGPEASDLAPEDGAGEARAELVTVPESEVPAVAPAPGEIPVAGARRFRKAYLIWAAALVVAVLTFVSVRMPLRQHEAASIVSLPPGFTIVGRPAISTDGSQLAAAVEDAGHRRQLWVRSLRTGGGRFLPDTEGAAGPCWSPDGQTLIFFARNEVKSVSLNWGTVQRMCAAVTTSPAAWGPDGTILYSPGPNMPLFTLASEHGTVPATRKEAGETLGHTSPQFIDGRRFVFLAPNPVEHKSAVYVASLGSFERKLLLMDASEIGYAPPNNLLYLRDGMLLSRRFDFSRGVAIGPEERVALGPDGVRVRTFSVSRSGALVAPFVASDPKSDLAWHTRDGKVTGSLGQPGVHWQVTLAPDESAAAMNGPGPFGGRIELLRFGGPSAVTLTGETAHVLDAVWSPDSRSIAYQIYGSEKTVLMVRRLDQPQPRVLLDDGNSNYPDDWSPDGKWILCRRTANIVFIIAPDGHGGPQVLREGEHILDQLKFSPDGGWIAYNSDESGNTEVYVARFPKMDDVRRVSLDGGCQPLWRKDGKELYYLGPDGGLFSVDFDHGPGSQPGAPRLLFRSRVVVNAIIAQYAVTGDGNRFLMLEPRAGSESESSGGPVLLKRNWAARQE